MAADLDQAYAIWAHEQLSDPSQSEEMSITQMLDHGSISFGRYAVESLSWEKRSVFAHNRRQEELEKFKAPGLVAKKKAYFEEYYKKIRSTKGVADDNQQTEVALDYGADSSISSQTGEEDEFIMQAKDPRENVPAAGHQGYHDGALVDQKKDPSISFSVGYFGSDFSVSRSGPQNRYSSEINPEKKSSDTCWLTCLDVASQDSKRTQVSENSEKGSSDVSQVTHLNVYSGFTGRETCNIILKSNNDRASQMPHRDDVSAVYDAGHIKNEVCNTDLETNSRKNDCSISDFEPCCSSQPRHSTSTRSELDMLAPDCKQNKKQPSAYKKKYESNIKAKESVSTFLSQTKPRDKIRRDQVKSCDQSKHLQQKKVFNAASTNNSRKMDNSLLRNNASSLLSSCKPTHIRAKATIPCPFSFANEKRVIVEEQRPSTGLRSAREKINARAATTFRSLNHGRHELLLQNTPKKATVSSRATSSKVEERSRQQQLPSRKSLVMGNQLSKVMGRDGLGDRSRPRSINLPASERPQPHLICKSSYKQEGKVDTAHESRPVRNATTTARNSKTEVKKTLSLQRNNVAIDRNNKLRSEVRRWR